MKDTDTSYRARTRLGSGSDGSNFKLRCSIAEFPNHIMNCEGFVHDTSSEKLKLTEPVAMSPK